MNSEPQVAVMFEGTLCPSAVPSTLTVGPPNSDVILLLATIREGKCRPRVLVISAFAQTTRGTKILWDWLIEHGVGADDVWGSYGFPDAVLISNTVINPAVLGNADAAEYVALELESK